MTTKGRQYLSNNIVYFAAKKNEKVISLLCFQTFFRF